MTEFSEVMEILDSISDRNHAASRSVFIPCRPVSPAWIRRRMDMTNFLDRIDIRRGDSPRSGRRPSLFALFLGDLVETGSSRRTATAAMKARGNDEKWTVTRIPFNRPDTYTASRARARPLMKAPTKIVTFRFSAFFPVLPLFLCTSLPAPFHIVRPTVFCYFIHGYTVKTFTVVVEPAIGRGTREQRHNRPPRSSNNEGDRAL